MLPDRINWYIGVLTLILVVFSCVPQVSAQAQENTLEDIDSLLLDADSLTVDDDGIASDAEVEGVPSELFDEPQEAVDTTQESLVQDGTPTEFLPDQPLTDPLSVTKDVILVLDNSGSMRQNDPSFLTSQAVTEFIRGQDAATRLAIIIFDQDVSLAVPLTEVSIANRGDILDSLDRINYRGLFTDSPAAIERAIYELKNNGRNGVQKVIIFMTDGIVDTGNPQQDLDKGQWLRESLAPDAADAGIRIFGIAFTEDADFRLIQSLAQRTGGEYYRAILAEDLSRVFDQINRIINQPEPIVAEPEVETTSVVTPPPLPPERSETPMQPVESLGRDERIRSIIVMSGVAVMILALLVILILLVRRGREIKAAGQEVITEAYLNDIHGFTSAPSYKLGVKPTMLGRISGMDKEHLDYIVIPESTIGRRHSLIEYKDYAFWIVDQGSINGTFVNDKPITSETRLKHGDKVRLHKFEFEFVMPEMVDAGMTVVSNTVMAAHGHQEVDATAIRKSVADEAAGLDFDLGFGDTTENSESEAQVDDQDFDSEDETLMPSSGTADSDNTDAGFEEPDQDIDSEDETVMPDAESVTPASGTPRPVPAGDDTDDEVPEDATLMPGNFNLPEDDATIRKESIDDSGGFENLFGDDPDDDRK